MIETIRGVVRGRTIELASDPGLTDGQEVEVTLHPSRAAGISSWGEGLRRSAGALASSWTAEDDQILEEIARERMRETRPELTD